MIMIVFCYGYTSFAPFSVSDFFIFYTLLLVGKFKVYSPAPHPPPPPPPFTQTTRNHEQAKILTSTQQPQ